MKLKKILNEIKNENYPIEIEVTKSWNGRYFSLSGVMDYDTFEKFDGIVVRK